MSHDRASALRPFAERYTQAWCSQDPARVAGFFSPGGSLTINGSASVGRDAIGAAARDFMTAFPDMVVAMDGLAAEGERFVYKWTLSGANTGPGGTGNRVRISGFEQWLIGADGLIADSQGHFDDAEYRRQLEQGLATE